MSTSLRDLGRRVDALPTTHFDADDLMRQGEARLRRRRLAAAVGTAVAVAVLVSTVPLTVSDRDAASPPAGPNHVDTGIVTPWPNGWVAQPYSSSVFLARVGEPTEVSVDAPGAKACPAFSPDGARLMIGTYTDGDAALSVFSVAADGTVSPLTTIPLDGVENIPCAIWAPDGRWAALGGGGAVWVVDTEAGEVRRLPGYDPRDLEWRPGTDELAITGRAVLDPVPFAGGDRDPGGRGFVGENAPIDIYTVSTGEVRTIDGVEAAELTWSPDGTTIAYTRAVSGAENTKSGITLIDADGTNQRPLTTDEYVADHGIGVTWSPRGDEIAYQRERTDCTGAACYERSEVVLVTATDTDPDTPIGTERVIPPVVDHLDISNFYRVFNHPPPFRAEPWYANSVTWSPDGTALLYSAGSAGLIVVPVDGARPAIVLSGDGLIGIDDEHATSPWLPLQQWQPVT